MVHGKSEELVRANIGILSVIVHIISKITLVRHPEHLLIVL